MSTVRKTKLSFLAVAAFALIASLALVNCGGGGGGGSSTTTPNPTYTVTYDGNGNTSGSVPTDSATYETGKTVTVKDNTGNLVKTGYSFTNWNSRADGSGTTYGASFTMGTANVTLYAKWTAKWTGTKQLGAAGKPTDGESVVVDKSGNVYVAGWTQGGLDGNTLAGRQDFMLAKYDSVGSKVYVKQTGVAGKDAMAFDVAVDGSGNVYVAGLTEGGLDGNTLTGRRDYFLTKYDSSGTKLYSKQTGSVGTDTYAMGVAVDGSGNVYVAGSTTGGLAGNTLTGTSDYFLTKYDSSGTKLYSKQTGSVGTDTYAMGVAVDGGGNV